MTEPNVRAKIQEALQASGGDRHDAQKLLITWAVRDPGLLLGMTKPHLKAIAAALIEHAARAKDSDETSDVGPDQFPRSTIEDMISEASGIRLTEKRNPHIPPPKSTERQASTMRKLAAAFTRKKK